MSDDSTMAGLVMATADSDTTGIISAEGSWSHAEVAKLAAQRAGWLQANRAPGAFHVAVLLDNCVDYLLWLEAAALVGATVVGANSTHRGDELARDLAHTECQLLITSSELLGLVDNLDLGAGIGTVHGESERVLVVDGPHGSERLLAHAGADVGDVLDPSITAETLGYLLFTSGTSGAPKAVKCSQGRLAAISSIVASMFSLTPDDVCYAAMPLFHSNALMAGWGPSVAGRAAIAVPTTGRFSASGFLPDVRRFGVTYFNYVGKPLSYILATPEEPDDAETSLRQCFGNEATPDDVDVFATRFGCAVAEAYGSSEGGAAISRTSDTPRGALGRASFDGTVVLDPETGEPCPMALFDEAGRLLNAEECIGELVSKSGGASFEGYWRNDEAMAARLKEGWYWTGDLAYQDADGFFYFAGRDHDWIRVDGENFASAPVERILTRHPRVSLAAVYAVPDIHVGDQVMAALEWIGDLDDVDAQGFGDFLAGQADLGTKWAPKYLRFSTALPVTATSKVLKKSLRAERWNTSDLLLWRPTTDLVFEALEEQSIATLNDAVSDRVL